MPVPSEPAGLAYFMAHLGDRHHTSADVDKRYVVGESYWSDGSEHYDIQRCIRNAEYLSALYGVEPSDWSEEEAAAIVRYRDREVIGIGGVAAYHVFSTGIADHYVETADTADITALDILLHPVGTPDGSGGYIAWNVPAQQRGGENMGGCRPIALRLTAALDRLRCGLPEHVLMDADARNALNHVAQWVAGRSVYRGVWCKPWMAGLTFRALIRYWETFRNADNDSARAAIVAEIPAAIEDGMEYVWTACWHPVGTPVDLGGGDMWEHGALRYTDVAMADSDFAAITGLLTGVVDSGSVFRGPASLSTQDDFYRHSGVQFSTHPGDTFGIVAYEGATRKFTINQDYTPGGGIVSGSTFTITPLEINDAGTGPAPDLNHMASPALAWLAWYRTVVSPDAGLAAQHLARHDAMFNGCLQCYRPTYSQKVANQSLLWMREAMAWRTAAVDGVPSTSVRIITRPGGVLLLQGGS